MTLYAAEIARSLRRRLVWALLLVALAGIAVLGVIAFVDSADLDLAAVRAGAEQHPAVVANWWMSSGDGVLLPAAFFLLMGALIGGAGVVGGEWRSGGLATLLTWEPRRVRLLATRLAAMATCAVAIAVGLQLVLLASLLPAVIAHGTAAGTDGEYAATVALAILRIAALAGFATVVGGCLASVTKSTAGSIVASWVWLSIGEAILRTRRPSTVPFLLTDNAARFLTWSRLGAGSGGRAPVAAGLLLAFYAAALTVLALLHFRRTDAIAA